MRGRTDTALVWERLGDAENYTVLLARRPARAGAIVCIVEDCREGGAATGARAVYEGNFDYGTSRRRRGRGGNPRLRVLGTGERIFGCECWWITEAEARRRELQQSR